MTHFGQVLEFIVGLAGFFAVITGLVLWLAHLEQTLHGSPPRTAPARAVRISTQQDQGDGCDRSTAR